jgi:2-haloacid dehalogenase
MERIDTVVFDLGGVLVDWNPRYLYRKITQDEKAMESFLAEVCDSAWNEKQDAGRPFAEAVAERVKSHPQHEAWIRAYFDRWEEMIASEIHGTVEILEELKEQNRVRLLALSNWSAETFPIAFKRFPFLSWFEKVLVSGEEKLIKPDPRFYKLLSERHGVKPETSVFIDDVQKNIDGASKLGFQTILFRTPEALRQKLSEMSVLLKK